MTSHRAQPRRESDLPQPLVQYPPAPSYPEPPVYPPYGPPPTYYGYPPAPTAAHGSRVPAWLLLVAAALSGLGTLLPWVNVTIFTATISVNGTSTGDGKIFLVAAAACIAFAVLIATAQIGKLAAIITLIGGGIIGIGGSYDLANASTALADDNNAGLVQIGDGLYITVIGGIALLVLSIMVLAKPSLK